MRIVNSYLGITMLYPGIWLPVVFWRFAGCSGRRSARGASSSESSSEAELLCKGLLPFSWCAFAGGRFCFGGFVFCALTTVSWLPLVPEISTETLLVSLREEG